MKCCDIIYMYLSQIRIICEKYASLAFVAAISEVKQTGNTTVNKLYAAKLFKNSAIHSSFLFSEE